MNDVNKHASAIIGTLLIEEKRLDPSSLTDSKLLQLCEHFGSQALEWRRKFIGLLPEVQKRRLFEKKGFNSIYEFAARLGGISERQVDVVLNVERKLENKPLLKQILQNGEVSVNKLARVASVATQENEEFWATQVRLLPQDALETLVHDEKFEQALPGNISDERVMRPHHGNSNSAFSQDLPIADDVRRELAELHRKGIDINDLLREFLRQRKKKITEEKERISLEIEQTESRHIPVETERVLEQEYGTKCSIRNCPKDSVSIHHTQRFALAKTHDPHYLAPLCKEHHAIAHAIDVRVQERRVR